MKKFFIFFFAVFIFLSFSALPSYAATREKTVEFFINNSIQNIAKTKWFNSSFYINLPENSVAVKSAHIELYGVAWAGLSNAYELYLNNTLIGNYTMPAGAEGYSFRILANGTNTSNGMLYGLGSNTISWFNLSVLTKNNSMNAPSAKAVITYDYDDTSATQLQTVSYYINNSAPQIASNGIFKANFSIDLPDTSPSVKSAWIEIGALTKVAAAMTLTEKFNSTDLKGGTAINLTGATLEQQSFIVNVNASTAATNDMLYSLGNTPVMFNSSTTCAGDVCNALYKKAFVTYTFTAQKQKTLYFFVNSTGNSLALGNWYNYTFKTPRLYGTSPVVRNAYFEIFGSTAGTTNTMNVYLDNVRNYPGTVNISLDTGTAEAEAFKIVVNGTGSTNATGGLYTINTNGEYFFKLSIRCEAAACSSISADGAITYTYSGTDNSTSVQYFSNSTGYQLPSNGWLNNTGSVALPDSTIVVSSSWIDTSANTGGTAAFTENVIMGSERVPNDNTAIANSGTGQPSYGFLGVKNATNTSTSNRPYDITDNTVTGFRIGVQCAGTVCSAAGQKYWITYSYLVAAVDSAPPQLFETGTNATAVAPGGEVLIYSNWTDDTALSWATLQTNETGTAQNYTVSYAPISLSSTSSWSNFTWRNSSIAGGTEVQWKIFANDSTNNTNGTAGATFRIFQQVNQPIEQSLTINFQNQNIQSLFSVIRNAITTTLQVDKVSTFFKTTNNAMTTNIAFTSVSSFFRSISNTVTTNAAVKSITSFFRALNLAVTTSLAATTIGSFFKIISNAITTNTVVGPVSSLFKIISQAFAQNSALTTARGTLVSVSQAITQNAAVQTATSLLRTISQTITPNNITKQVGSFLRPISQAVAQNSVVQSVSSIFKTISQAITQNAITKTISSLFRTISQTFTQTTATQALSSIFKTISQAVTQNSATKTVSSIFKTISQAVTQNAATQTVFSIFRTISQTVTANTLAQSTSSIFKTISQAVTQNAAAQTIQSIFKTISQAVTQNSATQTVFSIFRTISQAVTQNSATQTVFSIFRTISQAVTQNSATQTVFSFFRSIQQSVSANFITQPLNSFFRAISNSITQSSVAKSVSSIFKNISEFLTANTANKIASNFLRSVSQYFQPQAFGFGGAYHRFFVSVSQAITHNFNLFVSTMRAPPHPTGPEVVVVSGGGPGLGGTRIQPTIPLKQATPAAIQFLKQPVIREVIVGEPIVDGIIVKNIGGRAVEELEAEVSGIEQKWITILPSTIDLEPEEKRGFTLFITAPKDAEEGDYTISFKLTANGVEEKTAFMLRVKKFAPVLDKAVTKRAVAVDVENKKTDIVVNVQNGPETRHNVLVTENIKKEIASSTDFIEFKDKPDEIIEKDPIVRWKIKELAPFETKNFTYTVKQVLPEYTAYVYWPTEEVALSPGILQGLRVAPFKPIELTGGRITPAPVLVENIGNKSRNVSVGMGLPEGWSLIPLQINYTIIPNETKLFAFNILLPTDVYPGYYIGKVQIAADGETMIKEYEFAVLNNLELLVRPLVIVVVLFFGIGVVWIRLKIIELNVELDEIKRLTEVRRSKEEIEAQEQKVRKGLRDLELLYRDNVIDDYTYQEEKEKAKKTMARLSKDLKFEEKRAKAEKPKKLGRVKEVYGRAEKLEREAEELDRDYSKGIIKNEYYKKRKAEIAGEAKKIKSALVGNKQVLEDIKKLLESRKSLLNGIKKLKNAYDEGFITRNVYESGESDLKKRISAVNASLRKESGIIEKSREKIIGSNLFLKILSEIKV